MAEKLPGDPIVVSYAPQERVLERACVAICHAGLNTVLDSLAAGVPLVTVPLTFEQPAIARRLERTGAGCYLYVRGLDTESLTEQVRRVVTEPTFRQSARKMHDEIANSGGVSRAAEVVHEAIGRH